MRWNLHDDFYIQITFAAFGIRNALALDFIKFAVCSSGRESELDFLSVKRSDIERNTQSRLSKSDRNGTIKVAAVALKIFMLLDMEHDD